MTINQTNELSDKERIILNKVPLEIREFWENKFEQNSQYFISNDELLPSYGIWRDTGTSALLLAEVSKNTAEQNIKYYLCDGQYQETPYGEAQMLKIIRMKAFI